MLTRETRAKIEVLLHQAKTSNKGSWTYDTRPERIYTSTGSLTFLLAEWIDKANTHVTHLNTFRSKKVYRNTMRYITSAAPKNLIPLLEAILKETENPNEVRSCNCCVIQQACLPGCPCGEG